MTGQHALPAAAVGALQAALAAEQAACYGYGVVGSHVSGAAAATAGSDWVAHQVARDSLTATITAAGAQPVPAAVAYQLPVRVQSEADARSLAVLLEEGVGRAYLALVALSDRSLRALGARELTDSALRAAYWRRGTIAFPGQSDASARS